jgi:molybdopterin-guanine dinucleotide biosynthesis protein B
MVGSATDVAVETRLPTVHLDDIEAAAALLLRAAMPVEEAVARSAAMR